MSEAILAVTPALATFITAQRTARLPEEHRDLATRHILDTLAAIVACRDLEPAVLARDYALRLSGDARRSAATILGTRERASIVDAVFASAMAGHGAEINDFIPSAFVQPGPAIVSAALADSSFERPMSAVVCRLWRCRSDRSTTSKSTMPIVPTPAAAR